MAGDYLKYDKTLPDKPEVYAIAQNTGLERDVVIGKLLRIWSWADDHCENESCNALPVLLDDLVGFPTFTDAMRDVGWLESNGSTIRFPGFAKYQAQTSYSRALTRDRVRRHRDKKRNALPPVTVTPEKRREEKKNITPPNPPKGERDFWAKAVQAMRGDCLNTVRFESVWAEWNDERRKAGRKAYTRRGATGQIRKLEAMGHDRAIAAIKHSITEGYAGIFEGGSRGAGSAKRQAPRTGTRGRTAEDRGEYAEPPSDVRDLIVNSD